MEKMKTVKVSNDFHKKLKIYSAKAEINITDVVENAVNIFMKDFPAEFLINNCNPKSNKPKK